MVKPNQCSNIFLYELLSHMLAGDKYPKQFT